MYKLSENCTTGERNIFNGKGNVQMKVLAKPDEMYKNARLFNHVTIQPGCSIGYHDHNHETEFYYIIKGEAVFNDDGKEVIFRAGDIGATGYGQGHGIENRSDEPVEMIATFAETAFAKAWDSVSSSPWLGAFNTAQARSSPCCSSTASSGSSMSPVSSILP